MPVSGKHLAPQILQGIAVTTELGALTAVGAAPGDNLADVALPAVGDAQGAVHKHLENNRGRLTNAANLGQGQLPCQHHLSKADVLEETHLFRAAVIALRRGMQGQGRQGTLQQAHVLDDEGVDASLVELPGVALRLLQLAVVENGVECHINPGLETVGGSGQRCDIGDAVGGGGAGAEGRATDIDSIGAMVDGGQAAGEVASRGEEFYATLGGHGRRGGR